MPRPATGELRRLANGWEARIRIEGKVRKGFALLASLSDDDAAHRCRAMASLAQRLRTAGHTAEAPQLLAMAANARPGRPWDAILAAVDALCAGQTQAIDAPDLPTLAEHIEAWTDGKLAKKYPHHVKVKRSADGDACRAAKHITPHIGEVPVNQVTLDHCEIVMASIPEQRSDGTRRQVAQLLRRALALAVYPCRYRTDLPIPKGWLPNAKSTKAKECLYPDEDARLLACRDVPLLRRLAYGFLSREGMRTDELSRLQWRDVDLERGKVYLDENKTDDPRDWDLDPGVLGALRGWHDDFCPRAEPDDRVFAENGVPLSVARLAKQLRHDLKAAGVTRDRLFAAGPNRIAIRAHDLRATFITIALATGKTETWVADRTGHTSSAMIQRYRRKARTWAGQQLGTLAPLYRAVPELNAPGIGPDLVGQPGLEPETNGLREHAAVAEIAAYRENSAIRDPGHDETTLDTTAVGQSWGDRDAVEHALGKALEAATAAGRFDVVAQLAKELEARRLSRVRGVDLAPARSAR